MDDWKMKPKAVKLLRRVVRRIGVNPKRLDMALWGDREQDHRREEDDLRDRHEGKWPTCGTVGCIAGWIAMDHLTLPQIKTMSYRQYGALFKSVAYRASKKLGLTIYETETLFHVEGWPGWPERFRLPFLKARGPKTRYKILKKRVEHFIKTGE